MADPLSVAGSIAGLLSIADIVFRKLYQYVKTAKKAEIEVQKLKNEVATLTGVLHNLHLVVEELEDDSTIDNAIKVDHVASCSATLKRIDSVLSSIQFPKDQKIQNAIQRLKWPFKATETKEIGDEVRRHRETLSLALSADSMTALLQCLSTQKSIIKQLDNIQETLQRNKDFQLGIALNEDRRRILKSFFTVEPRQYFETSLSLRHSGTGSWLYEDTTFQGWLQDPGSRVWLTGIPGAGKTVLSATIIQGCLTRSSATQAIAVAYYYCDYKSTDSQNVVNIFSALAGQIAMKNEVSFVLLKDYYDQLHARDQMEQQPKTEELIKIIQDMASTFDDVRIVVDGLDECGEAMAAVAESLHNLVCAPRATISLAILSRREQAIRDVFEEDDTYTHIEIAAHKEDIESYVQSEIDERTRNRRLRIRSPELKLLIAQELVSKADGMFRWVACQLDHLCDLATDSQRRKALKELPKTLEETYDRILLRVKRPVAPLVSSTLQWLAHATTKLEVDALLEALSIDDDTDVLNPEDRPTEEDLLMHCSSLIRKTGAYLELAHFTVQEYLGALPTDHSKLSQFRLVHGSKALLAKTCLSYLCLPDFNIPPKPILGDIVSFTDKFPFHTHASNAWSRYMDNSWSDIGLRPLYRRLFDPEKTPNFVLCTVQRLLGEGVVRGQGTLIQAAVDSYIIQDVFNKDFRPLHAAAMFGLKEVCQWLVNQGCDLDMPSSWGPPLTLCIDTMLKYSNTYLGYISVDDSAIAATAAFLMESGAYCENERDRIQHFIGTPGDKFDILRSVKSFAERAARPLSHAYKSMSDSNFNARLKYYISDDQVERIRDFSKDPRFFLESKSLLTCAAEYGAVRTMALLLDLGVDPTSRDEYGRNVLFKCMKVDNEEILSRLMTFPGIEHPDKGGATIWHYAARLGAFRMLKLWVEFHSETAPRLIDVYEGKTPMMWAIASGSEQCCLLLAQTMQAHRLAFDDPAIVHGCVAMGLSQVLIQLLDYGVD
ncbi:ankyrin, partial [Cucurbitaria berberidis CBS 394.84]